MAEIVLGLGASHGPPVTMPASQWPLLREKDMRDKRMDYEALLKTARPGMEDECTDERMAARYDAAQRALGTLRQELLSAAPDVVVVVGDDQNEQFGSDQMPTFCVYRGPSLEVKKRTAGGGQWGNMAWREASQADIGEAPKTYEAAPQLADHLIESLIEAEFDVSCSSEMRPDVGLGHAFSFLYRTILPEGNIPVLPVMVNTMFKPNYPTPGRCYKLGQAMRRAIEAWDASQRVAIMASGGLSHVIIDEDLDRTVIDALMEKDAEQLCSLPRERLNRAAGTTEIRNWIVLAGAMEPLNMTLASYEPCYRSPAGTGLGMAFAHWK
jgi:hypothetical protein